MLWLSAGLGVFAVVGMIARWYGRGRHTDLGFVSHRWIAEHRLSEQHEPSR